MIHKYTLERVPYCEIVNKAVMHYVAILRYLGEMARCECLQRGCRVKYLRFN